MKLPQYPEDPPAGSSNRADAALNDPLERIDVWVGDITELPMDLGVDAIVNAANESLLGGGGVDGAIHRAAGPELLAHTRCLGGCPTGLAKITPSFELKSKGINHIIHTVGPVWSNQQDTGVPGAPGDESAKLGYTLEDNLLASCYIQTLQLAEQHGINHLAIPAISTGVYRFPKPRAAKIAFGHVHGHLQRNQHPGRVTFVCFSEENAVVYREVIQSRGDWMVSRSRV